MSRWLWISRLQLTGGPKSPVVSQSPQVKQPEGRRFFFNESLNLKFSLVALHLSTLSESLTHPPPPLPPSGRKLLEGEETRIGTGITYPGPTMGSGGGQGYSYQSRIYTSSSRGGGKKEGKDDDQQVKAGGKVSQREVYEETVVTTKKMEKQQESGDASTNQKN